MWRRCHFLVKEKPKVFYNRWWLYHYIAKPELHCRVPLNSMSRCCHKQLCLLLIELQFVLTHPFINVRDVRWKLRERFSYAGRFSGFESAIQLCVISIDVVLRLWDDVISPSGRVYRLNRVGPMTIPCGTLGLHAWVHEYQSRCLISSLDLSVRWDMTQTIPKLFMLLLACLSAALTACDGLWYRRRLTDPAVPSILSPFCLSIAWIMSPWTRSKGKFQLLSINNDYWYRW